jgi:hypothetical protein
MNQLPCFEVCQRTRYVAGLYLGELLEALPYFSAAELIEIAQGLHAASGRAVAELEARFAAGLQ